MPIIGLFSLSTCHFSSLNYITQMDIKDLEAVIRNAKREGIDVSIAEKQLSMRRIFELQVDENMRKDTASKQSTEMQLEASMYAAKYDTFGDLVKMICVAQASGVEVGDAEKKLLELKAEKDRKNEILSILEASMLEVRPENIDALELAVENAEQEGLNVVQAQLLLLQMRNERRKVADAAAQLVKVVQSVGYDAESLENLELAISQAIDAHVSKENIEKARQLLDSLKEGKQLLDEAMIVLQAAMKERNLPQLVEAVSTASEIGFHHEQLQDDLNHAKTIINEIKKEEQDDSLKKITEESTEDSYEALMSAIERSKGTKCNPVRLANAQAVLADLKQRKIEKDEVMYALRFAINERDVGLIISALQSANAKGMQGQEVRVVCLLALSNCILYYDWRWRQILIKNDILGMNNELNSDIFLSSSFIEYTSSWTLLYPLCGLYSGNKQKKTFWLRWIVPM